MKTPDEINDIARKLAGQDTDSLRQVFARAIEEHLRKLSPREGLQLLFNIENMLYPLMGRLAIDFNGGLHPKHRHMKYHDFFVTRIKPGQKVLDIGCGNGALSFDLAQKAGAEVTAVDMNARNIEMANQRYAHPGVRYIHANALSDLPGHIFDVIVMSNVLEHLDQRVEFLKKVFASTQATQILLRVPVFERHWSVPLKKELGMEWRLDPTHETEYTLESFNEEMRCAALEISHIEVRWGEIWASARPLRDG